jgi:hypothetical protein
MTTSSALPQTPQNLLLSITGDDIHLSWDEVSQDGHNSPINISYYEVHVGDQLYFICDNESLLLSQEDNTFTKPSIGDAGTDTDLPVVLPIVSRMLDFELRICSVTVTEPLFFFNYVIFSEMALMPF